MGLVTIDWNNPEEVRKYRAQKSREYRARVKARAEAGDKEAQKLREKNNERRPFAQCKTYLRRHANLKELREVKEIILNREKELKQKNI